MEVEPLTKAKLSKNTASLGCHNSTRGVPISHPFLMYSTSLFPILLPPHRATPQQQHQSRVAMRVRSERAKQDIPKPLSQGSLPHPGGSAIQPAVQILSPPPDGEASWDTGLLEVRVPLSPT